MCDYSLHNVASRPARVGDKLTSTKFKDSITRGFAAADQPNVAVCLLPGTELAFDRNVSVDSKFRFLPNKSIGQKLARFRQINMHEPLVHHDSLEFKDGGTVLVTNLAEGQTCTVLQLPAQAQPEKRDAASELGSAAVAAAMTQPVEPIAPRETVRA
jgi:hypothetical protein